jgi:voltage-gated potassium channel
VNTVARRSDRRAEIHDRIARSSNLPMVILSVVFVAVVAWPIADPGLSPATRRALSAADFGIWAAFAVEYLALLVTAPRRLHFARAHVADLVVVAVPVLRPLRILRATRALRLLRFARLAALVIESVQRSRARLVATAAATAAVFAGAVVLLSSLVVVDAERHARGSNIHGFTDGLWWSVTTITTVGYGDRFPVTGVGRAVAAVLMLTGVVLLGIVTAAMASWFVSITSGQDQTDELTALRQEISLLSQTVLDLKQELTGARVQVPT